MKKLLSDLTGLYSGKPILVIGGGPSASADLAKLALGRGMQFACVISANGHGFKQDHFAVDYIVGVDFTFGSGTQSMSDYVKQFAPAKTINRWSWADYRIPEWIFGGDSGLTAIQVAVMLGGHPVVAVGMDRYVGEKRYFWQAVPEAGWANRRQAHNINGQSSLQAVVDFCRCSDVRVLSGPLREHWPLLQSYPLMPWQRHPAPQVVLTGHKYSLLEPIFLHPTDRVDGGPVLLTNNEAKPFLNMKKIVKLETC